MALDESEPFNGDLHYLDPNFVKISFKMPIETFNNPDVPDLSIHYRQSGDHKLNEAVIVIPSIYETESSFFRTAVLFDELDIRLIVLNIGNHTTFPLLIDTMNLFLKHLHIKKVHFIGINFGGFVALQIQNSRNILFDIESMILINAFTTNTYYLHPESTAAKLFTAIATRTKLEKELEADGLFTEPVTESLKFIRKDINSLDRREAKCRVTLRQSLTSRIVLHVPDEAVMSIETMDRKIVLPDIVSETFPDVKLAMMKNGGDFPHLEAPDDLYPYLLCHIRQHWKSFQIGQDD